MGGMGSGRWGSGRRRVENVPGLDIARLRREGFLRGLPMKLCWYRGDDEAGSIGILALANGVRLIYRTLTGAAEWQKVDELVPIVRTPMHFGGHREWFRCLNCGRNCRVLFAGPRFRCRHCHGIRYSSQSETKADRATRAMLKIVKRLDPEQHYNHLPCKPKAMHWRTYNRIAERYARYEELWGREAMRRFGVKF